MFFSKEKKYTLTPTQTQLLTLLRAQLWLQPVDDIALPTTMEEWDDLLDTAYKQTVVCFIAAACLRHKDVASIPESIREEMEAVIEVNAKIHDYHNSVLLDLIDKFESQGLHPILLKGQSLAQMYDSVGTADHPCTNSLLRQCGDIDMYFAPDEYEKAMEYMMTVEDKNVHHHKNKKHYDTQYLGVTVELHRTTAWLPNPFANKRFHQITLDEMKHPGVLTIQDKDVFVPSALYNLVFTFVHLWNHFENKGINLRQVCDVCILVSAYSQKIKSEELHRVLAEVSFVRPWKICGSVLQQSFKMESMLFYSPEKKNIEKGHMMLQRMFLEGAFNFQKNKQLLQGYSGLRKKCMENYLHIKEYAELYSIVGKRMIWRYIALKHKVLYNNLCRLS